MSRDKISQLLRYWAFGTGIVLVIFAIYWFTGWRKYGGVEPHTFNDLVNATVHFPHIIIGVPLLLGLALGLLLRFLFGNK
jgi:NhaP-type Na+/H+ or K+/H+ antiporter